MALPNRKRYIQKDINLPPDVPTIFEAAASNNIDMLEVALQYYDVNDIDENGMSGLHYAAASLSFETAKRLLMESNLNVFLKDNFGREAAIMGFETNGFTSDEAAKMNVLIWPPHPDDDDLYL